MEYLHNNNYDSAPTGLQPIMAGEAAELTISSWSGVSFSVKDHLVSHTCE